MVKRSAARRAADACFAFASWVAAAAAVMWFYDWVSRWYIVVGVLLVIVAGATLGDLLKAEREPSSGAPSAEVAHLVPAPREPLEQTSIAS
jgi:hypothetical protein